MKLVVNQAYENMGLGATQTLGPILDGLMRNTPDALEFIERAECRGRAARWSPSATARSATTRPAPAGAPARSAATSSSRST